MMSMAHQPSWMSSVPPYPSATVEPPCHSPPASSCSTGTGIAGSPHSGTEVNNCHTVCQQQSGVASMMPASAGNSHKPATAGRSKEWLYRLVMFPSYFTPCVNCCSGSRTPKREQLMTLFDTEYPFQVYCSHCPECKTRTNGTLMQVRRSAFKDVVKATDIQRFGADVAGVQQYTLNGSKVIYLNREQTPEKKGSGASTAPAQCSVDGRAMMDKSSQYCSLKCKMHAEDPGFNQWLDQQDPSVRILAQAAANAPPRPTVACKRAAQPCSSTSSDECPTDISGSSSMGSGRPKKAARTSSSGATIGAAAGAPASHGTAGESAAPAAAFAGLSGGSRVPVRHASTRQQQQLPSMLQRAASSTAPAPAAPAAGLKAIKTTQAGGRQHSAPTAFLAAAMADPPLGPPCTAGCSKQGSAAAAAAAVGSGYSSGWLPGPAELESWDSDLSSPSFAGLDDIDSWEVVGSLSPSLVDGSVSSSAEWWLGSGSGTGSAFAGMGGVMMGQSPVDVCDDLDAGLLVPSGVDAADMLLAGSECLSGAALMLPAAPASDLLVARSAPAAFMDRALPLPGCC